MIRGEAEIERGKLDTRSVQSSIMEGGLNDLDNGDPVHRHADSGQAALFHFLDF